MGSGVSNVAGRRRRVELELAAVTLCVNIAYSSMRGGRVNDKHRYIHDDLHAVCRVDPVRGLAFVVRRHHLTELYLCRSHRYLPNWYIDAYAGNADNNESICRTIYSPAGCTSRFDGLR
jgi:hypothetical protein